MKSTSFWTWLLAASCDAPLFSYWRRLTGNPCSWLCRSFSYHPLAASFPARRVLVQLVVPCMKHTLYFFLSPCSSPDLFQYCSVFFRGVGNGNSQSPQHVDVSWISTGAYRYSLVYSLFSSFLMFSLSSWQPPSTKLTLAWSTTIIIIYYNHKIRFLSGNGQIRAHHLNVKKWLIFHMHIVTVFSLLRFFCNASYSILVFITPSN